MNNKIRFSLPIDIQKGKNSRGEDVYKFKGLASTIDRDNQGEILDSSVYDLTAFKTVNWNHKSKDNAEAYLGEISKHDINQQGLFVEGELFNEMPMTKSVVSLMKAFKKRGKKLQLSVEGSVLQRGSDDENHPDYKKILKAKLTGVAITPNPVNSNTFCELIEKGETDIIEWDYDAQTEQLIKSVESGELIDEEKDEQETEKAMIAEETLNVSKESVEGKEKKDDENQTNNSLNNVSLSKSEVYENIFSYFHSIDLVKAKEIYSLIQKISDNMSKPITSETIKKAMEILDLATTTKVDQIKKSDDNDADDMSGEEENDSNEGGEEKEDALEKAKDKKKAKDSADDLNKSLEILSNVIEKSNKVTIATATIVKALYDSNESLQSENDLIKSEISDLKKSFDEFLSTPQLRKSLETNVAPIDRFAKAKELGAETYNINDKAQRRDLINKCMDLSGIDIAKQSGDLNKADKTLLDIATGLETTGAIAPENVKYLLNKKIVVY